MKRQIGSAMIVVALLGTAPAVLAGGGKGGSSGSGGQRARATATGQTRPDARGAAVAVPQMTERQRRQYEVATGAAARVRTEARELARAAKHGELGGGEAAATRDQLREQVRLMQEQHQRLMQGLDVAQRQAAGERLQRMERTLERVTERHRVLDGALGRAASDPRRLSKQARELAHEVSRWQRQYGRLGDDLGVVG